MSFQCVELPSPRKSLRKLSVRQNQTEPEIALSREHFRNGFRYRVDYSVNKKPLRVADLAFQRPKVAVFVADCFWHCCLMHVNWSKSNAYLWRQ